MSQTDNQNTKIPREPVTARGILVPAAAGIIMGLIVLWIRDGFSPCDEATLWTNLTDALTVPGVILTCTHDTPERTQFVLDDVQRQLHDWPFLLLQNVHSPFIIVARRYCHDMPPA